MPAGSLIYLFAFEVEPNQTAGFQGSSLTNLATFQEALDNAFDKSKLAVAPVANFVIETSSKSRSHPVRDAVLAAVTGTKSAGRLAAVETLAVRWGDAMDLRPIAAARLAGDWVSLLREERQDRFGQLGAGLHPRLLTAGPHCVAERSTSGLQSIPD